jgi:hypothetical protein
MENCLQLRVDLTRGRSSHRPALAPGGEQQGLGVVGVVVGREDQAFNRALIDRSNASFDSSPG